MRLTLINRFDEIGKAARDAAGWHACLDALLRRRWTRPRGDAARRAGWHAADVRPGCARAGSHAPITRPRRASVPSRDHGPPS